MLKRQNLQLLRHKVNIHHSRFIFELEIFAILLLSTTFRNLCNSFRQDTRTRAATRRAEALETLQRVSSFMDSVPGGDFISEKRMAQEINKIEDRYKEDCSPVKVASQQAKKSPPMSSCASR